MNKIVTILLGVTLGTIAGWASPATASATWTQPTGGCKEAWQAPQSVGADDCREHGWRISSRFVINPHARLVANLLPPLPTEDSVGGYWDAAQRGNGRGASFVVTRGGVRIYVWMHGLADGWEYVKYGSRLDEIPGVSIRTRVRFGPTTVMRNPSMRTWRS